MESSAKLHGQKTNSLHLLANKITLVREFVLLRFRYMADTVSVSVLLPQRQASGLKSDSQDHCP
jgi:hypothetical protein